MSAKLEELNSQFLFFVRFAFRFLRSSFLFWQLVILAVTFYGNFWSILSWNRVMHSFKMFASLPACFRALIFVWGGFTYHHTAIHGRAVVTEADNEMTERDNRLLTAVRLLRNPSSHYVTLHELRYHEMTSHYMISLYPFLSVLAFHLIFFSAFALTLRYMTLHKMIFLFVLAST